MRSHHLRAGLPAPEASCCIHCGEPAALGCRCAGAARSPMTFGLLPAFAAHGPRRFGSA
ncbi:MAG TPA: hypothetical protein VHH36_04080 [Candidatus Thermoplasmatota archaeon]|nr:hypothetical protein [Candidatus Thermoplasmatota archaeon]